MKDYYNIEFYNSAEYEYNLSPKHVPEFSYGLEYLGIEKNEIGAFAREWFKNLDYLQPKFYSRVVVKNNVFHIRKSKFQIDKVSKSPGKDVAMIVLMHWNGKVKNYDRAMTIIRRSLLPVTTVIHHKDRKTSPMDFETISPNIGKTVYNFMTTIQDIAYAARYLRSIGYKHVGLFGISKGSCEALVCSMANPELFDFALIHMLADDFPEIIMKGVLTRSVAAKIRKKGNIRLIKKLWSVISPKNYQKHFHKLPKNLRLVQAKYDYAFGIKNVEKFTKRLLRKRRDTEIEYVNNTHTTFGKLPDGFKALIGDIRFIYKHTPMKDHRLSKILNYQFRKNK